MTKKPETNAHVLVRGTPEAEAAIEKTRQLLLTPARDATLHRRSFLPNRANSSPANTSSPDPHIADTEPENTVVENPRDLPDDGRRKLPM